jgi:hypothetical protein
MGEPEQISISYKDLTDSATYTSGLVHDIDEHVDLVKHCAECGKVAGYGLRTFDITLCFTYKSHHGGHFASADIVRILTCICKGGSHRFGRVWSRKLYLNPTLPLRSISTSFDADIQVDL